MEAETVMTLPEKLSKVRKSCKTPEHFKALKRYRQLYDAAVKRYNNDWGYRAKIDAGLLVITSTLCAAIIVFVVAFFVLRALHG
jgi:hypothetical protein